MPAPLQNSIVHTVYYTVWYHIYTYWYPCSLFTYILLFFLIQASIIQFSVIIKVRSQHAVPVSVVRQWLDRHQTGVKKSSGRGQKIIRQGSSNHQAVVKQSVKKPMHNCWFFFRHLAKNTSSFGSNMNLIAPFIGWKA